MKKILVSSAIALSFLLAFTSPALAGDKVPGTEMKVAGFIKNQPVYQLRINNSLSSSYYIVVKDEYGVVLHDETITGSAIVRNYQLNIVELGNTAVIFEVFNSNGFLISTFKVNVKEANTPAVAYNKAK